MMHKKNFVAAIKADGKVLRESSDRVQLPFGSEYSVLLKNLDTVRVQAKIDIDGQEACQWVVIDPGQSVEIERFFRGNREQGNRFKFIERTQRIEDHRGIKAEDGLVRVEFKREKVYEPSKIVEHHTYHHHTWPYVYPRPHIPPYYPHWNFCGTLSDASYSGTRSLVSQSGGLVANASASNTRGTRSGPGSQSLGALNVSNSVTDMYKYSQQNMQYAEQERGNEAGITVQGGISNQKFISVAGFECESSEAIVLHLVGRSGAQPIRVAKTVEQKPICETCGTKNKGTAKFCIECGTLLEKV